MTSHPEHEEKKEAPESKKSSDSKAADDSKTPSKADLVRLKLKLFASYAVRGFAPVVAVLALAIAVIAFISNQSSQALISKAAARIDNMNANLSASRGELEKLKATIKQEKTMQEEERKKQDERVKNIIQNVTKLQVKMKISPTLEEQSVQPASASAAAPTAVAPAVARNPSTAFASTGDNKKPSPQVQGLKEAIEKFNKK